MIRVSKYYRHPVEVDGETLDIRIKRMSVEEHITFNQKARRTSTPTFVRFVSREPNGPEQERDEKGQYKLSLEDLAAQKITELPAEKRAEFDAAVEADELAAQEFLKYVFAEFVRCAGGLVEVDDDDTENTVHEGLDVLRIFGARDDVLRLIMAGVRVENELSAQSKKDFRSGLDSITSLKGSDLDLVGQKLETTAPPVLTEDSAETEGAKTPQENGSSGSTATSPSENALSSV